jgi:hypothetical protein
LREGELVRAGFEQKFLVPEGLAEELLGAVAAQLAPDPNGRCYSVASLYLDTLDLAAFRREVAGKWRIRRYGTGNVLFVEYKARPEPGQVCKRRSQITPEQCPRLAKGDGPGWFIRSILKEDLAPVCQISYTRHAFVGEGGIRLTLDSGIRAVSCPHFAVPTPLSAGEALTSDRILEIKFEHELPPALGTLLENLGLLPESFSKYRAAVRRLRLPDAAK